jgi:anti-sigma factor RsiW
MTCEDVHQHLHDVARGRADPALHAELAAHVGGCAACQRAQEAEVALDDVLAHRLPRYTAPLALKRRLALRLGTPDAARAAPARWTRVLAPALAASVALVAGGAYLQRGTTQRAGLATLTSEVVNDHLRVLASQHPVDIESGGNHQVKPWFEGKLDFAPVVPAPEGGELTLRGGSVGYVFDRKAAVLVYGLRLHVVTLLVFRADGLEWPGAGDLQRGPPQLSERSARGFNVVLWRSGGLGYALVSDLNPAELGEVAARVSAATAAPRGP